MRYEIRSTLTLDDFLDLNEVGLGRGVLMSRILGAVAILVGLAVLALGGDFTVWLPTMIFGGLVTVFMSRPGLRWQLARKTKGVIGSEMVVAVDDEGVEIHNAGTTGRMPWSSITRARSNERAVVLMRDRVIYGWFTFRTLDPATRAQVLEMIQRHVPDFA